MTEYASLHWYEVSVILMLVNIVFTFCYLTLTLLENYQKFSFQDNWMKRGQKFWNKSKSSRHSQVATQRNYTYSICTHVPVYTNGHTRNNTHISLYVRRRILMSTTKKIVNSFENSEWKRFTPWLSTSEASRSGLLLGDSLYHCLTEEEADTFPWKLNTISIW